MQIHPQHSFQHPCQLLLWLRLLMQLRDRVIGNREEKMDAAAAAFVDKD
jgi:hypothetical protein